MPVGSNLSFIGIAKEATPGTAVAASSFLPVSTLKPQINVAYLPDTGLRGSQAKTFDLRPGVSYATFDFDGAVYADVLGWIATGVLGDVATTGASAPYTHAVSLGNAGQPPSYTLSDYNGFNTRQFAGAKFSELQLKFAGNGLLEYSAKATAASFASTTKPAPSWATAPAAAAWLGVATIGGAASSLIVSGDLDIKRTVAPIDTVDGSASPYSIFAGGDLECSGSFIAVYEDDSLITPYTAGTTTSLDFSWTQGAGAALTQVKAHMTQAQITSAVITRSSGKYVELACKYEAIANTTDKGASGGFAPVALTIQNALPSGTYK